MTKGFYELVVSKEGFLAHNIVRLWEYRWGK